MNIRVQMISDLIAELAKDYPDLIKNMDVNPRQLPVIPLTVYIYQRSVWVCSTPDEHGGWAVKRRWGKEEEKEPEEFDQVFNIENKIGTRLLLHNVCRHDAEMWLKYYQDTYPAGKPYRYGYGSYPDFGFRIVKVI